MGNVLKGARAAPIGSGLYAPAGTQAAFPASSLHAVNSHRGREEHDATPPVKKKIRLKWLYTNEFCTLDQISRILYKE